MAKKPPQNPNPKPGVVQMSPEVMRQMREQAAEAGAEPAIAVSTRPLTPEEHQQALQQHIAASSDEQQRRIDEAQAAFDRGEGALTPESVRRFAEDIAQDLEDHQTVSAAAHAKLDAERASKSAGVTVMDAPKGWAYADSPGPFPSVVVAGLGGEAASHDANSTKPPMGGEPARPLDEHAEHLRLALETPGHPVREESLRMQAARKSLVAELTGHMDKSPGQVTYEAYGDKRGWVVGGKPMPSWAEQLRDKPDVAEGWEVAAAAVLARAHGANVAERLAAFDELAALLTPYGAVGEDFVAVLARLLEMVPPPSDARHGSFEAQLLDMVAAAGRWRKVQAEASRRGISERDLLAKVLGGVAEARAEALEGELAETKRQLEGAHAMLDSVTIKPGEKLEGVLVKHHAGRERYSVVSVRGTMVRELATDAPWHRAKDAMDKAVETLTPEDYR